MRVGNYMVTIEGGREIGNGYIAVKDGAQYGLVIRNHDWKKCDAVLKIDGKEIETFRLDGHQSLRIEGPPSDPQRGKFTFYQGGSTAAALADESAVSKDDKGLVVVVFKPEKQPSPSLTTMLNESVTSRRWTKSAPIRPGLQSWMSGVPQNAAENIKDDGHMSMCAAPAAGVNVSETFAAMEDERSTVLRGMKPGVTGLSGHTDQTWNKAPEIEHDDESKFVTFSVRLVVADESPRPLAAKGYETPVPPPVG